MRIIIESFKIKAARFFSINKLCDTSILKAKSKYHRKKIIAKTMKADWDKNKDVLQKVLERHHPLVILCGKLIEEQIGMDVRRICEEVDNPCHPTTFNVQTPNRYKEWLKYWDVGRVKEILNKRDVAPRGTRGSA